MELPTTYQSCTSQLVEKAQRARSGFKPLNGTAQSLGSERGQSARESASRVVPRIPGVRLARPSLASGRVGAPGPVGTSNRLGVQPSGMLVITGLLSWLNIPCKVVLFFPQFCCWRDDTTFGSCDSMYDWDGFSYLRYLWGHRAPQSCLFFAWMLLSRQPPGWTYCLDFDSWTVQGKHGVVSPDNKVTGCAQRASSKPCYFPHGVGEKMWTPSRSSPNLRSHGWPR